MPRVPQDTGPSVAEQGIPSAYQRSVASPELLSGPGRQLQGFGDAAVGDAVQLNEMARQRRAQADAMRVDDALNQLTEQSLRMAKDKDVGFESQTGYAALNRESGMPLSQEYTSKLQEQAGKIAATLDTPEQKQGFAMKANNVITSFYGQAADHERKEYHTYTLSVRDATVTNAQNALALNFTDPDNVQQQSTRIRSAIEGGQDAKGNFIPGSAQMQGKSAAWAREQADEAISKAHGEAVKSALESGNVNLAMAYFNKYSKEMTPKDVLAVQGTLTKDYDARQGATVGNAVFDSALPRIVPDDFNRVTALVMQAESGGKRYGADGNLLTSPTGAKGEMQVLDSTNKKPGYGVTPARDDSPEERARVGRDYLGAMIREYKGDLPKALAAYNAGPGAVDKALKSAEADHGKFGDWQTYLPAETQKYVQTITAQYTAGAGVPAKPTLAELHDAVTTTLGPNASPLAVKTAKEQITQRFTDQEKSAKQREEEVTAGAMQQLVQNGGKFGELPTSTRTALTQFAPSKVDNVLNFGARIAKGDDSTNPAVYLKLSDPNYLRTVSEAQLYTMRGELSQEDYKHFAGERAKLLNPSASTGPGDLNSSAIKTTLDQLLREMKIDPTPKDDGGNDAARVGAIRKYVDEQILSMQRDAGKKFTDAETTAAINKLASNSAQLKGWFSTYSAPAISAKPGDIPSDTRDAIKAAYKKQGVDDPTDAQVLDAFLHLNARGKK